MKKLFFGAFCASALLLTGCNAADNYLTFSGFAQGTTYSITVNLPSTTVKKNIEKNIEKVFFEMDNTFSMFNSSSLVSRINRNETDSITPLFEQCFVLSKEIHALTDGFFDPTVKPLVDAWGFGPEQRQREPNVDSILEFVGFDKIDLDGRRGRRIIKTDPRVEMDFSSIAKGFTVDMLAGMLDKSGAEDYLVEVGGEIRTRGVNKQRHSWRVGIDKPVEGLEREIEVVVELDGTPPHLNSIATSGNYRNRITGDDGRQWAHTIDPLTGYPIESEILSVSIASTSCAAADGWATGIMACGSVETAKRLLAHASRIEYYIIHTGGVERSQRFAGHTN